MATTNPGAVPAHSVSRTGDAAAMLDRCTKKSGTGWNTISTNDADAVVAEFKAHDDLHAYATRLRAYADALEAKIAKAKKLADDTKAALHMEYKLFVDDLFLVLAHLLSARHTISNLALSSPSHLHIEEMKPQLQAAYNGVEGAMTKLTEMRLALKMNSSSAASSGLAGQISNALTTVLVDLRCEMRKLDKQAAVAESSPPQQQKQQNLRDCCNCNCQQAEANRDHFHDDGSSSSSSGGCVHRTALADRVIDRAFDRHKNMLRESLREAQAELDKFRSGAMVQQLQRRIDELELKLKSERRSRQNQEKIESVADVNVVATSSAATSSAIELSGVDDMIASFKKRCELRQVLRAEQEQQQQRQRELAQQRENLERSADERRTVDFTALFDHMASFSSSIVDESLALERRKSDLFARCCALATSNTARSLHSQLQRKLAEVERSRAADHDDRVVAEVAAVPVARNPVPPAPATATTATVLMSGRRAVNNHGGGKTLDIRQKPLHGRRKDGGVHS